MTTPKKIRKFQGNTPSRLLSATLSDIQKALKSTKKSVTDLERLPTQYRNFAKLFSRE